MKINEVSKATDLPISTIRYYEKMGIIPAEYTLRDPNNYRIYDAQILHYLNVLKTSLELGFSIAEIRAMIEITNGSKETHQRILQEKIAEIEESQQKLESARQHLHNLIHTGDACEAGFGKLS